MESTERQGLGKNKPVSSIINNNNNNGNNITQKPWDPTPADTYLACDNFNSNKLNLSLLVYGYINFNMQNIDLYKTISEDVMTFCISFCYDINKMQDIADSFDSKYNSDHKTSLIYNKDFTKVTFRSKSFKNKYASLYGTLLLDTESVRKVWKLKVLKHNSNGAVFFKIGMHGPCGTFHVPMVVDIGDIISVLMIIDENKECELSFAINNRRSDILKLHFTFNWVNAKMKLYLSGISPSTQLQLLF
eukprot:554757_1